MPSCSRVFTRTARRPVPLSAAAGCGGGPARLASLPRVPALPSLTWRPPPAERTRPPRPRIKRPFGERLGRRAPPSFRDARSGRLPPSRPDAKTFDRALMTGPGPDRHPGVTGTTRPAGVGHQVCVQAATCTVNSDAACKDSCRRTESRRASF